MIFKETCLERLNKTMDVYKDDLVGFDAETVLRDGIALTDGEGNYTLYEDMGNGTHIPHVFFLKRHGVREICDEMLMEVFTNHGVERIMGLTPLSKRRNIKLNKELGLTSHGVIDTEVGPCEIVTLTKDNFLRERFCV